jgi:hypothetical protein
MNSSACPAAKLSEVDRKGLAIQALAGAATITDLAAQHVVSRKFVYEQVHRASAALDEVLPQAHRMMPCCLSCRSPRYGCVSLPWDYDYFMETARIDLDDTHGNTHYGVHTAAMAGTWMGVAYSFAGMRVVDGALRFAPTLPKQWPEVLTQADVVIGSLAQLDLHAY